MASPMTHAIAAVALGQAAAPSLRKRWSFWGVAIFCAVSQDLDVIGLWHGVDYNALWGHRGMTHSLLFAALLGCLGAFCIRGFKDGFFSLAVLFTIIAASHGVLDAFTNGGLGVAFFSPFNPKRYFFPWRPVNVSPITVKRFFSKRGWDILASEAKWIWTPSLLVGGFLYGFQRVVASKTVSADQ